MHSALTENAPAAQPAAHPAPPPGTGRAARGAANDAVKSAGPRAAIGFWLLVALLAATGAGKAVLYDTLDPDLFWHLRVAGQLRADGIGPVVDSISFASIRAPWTPYSWLAELGMLWTWEHLGWRGAVAIAALCNAAVVLLIALCSRELAGRERRLCSAVGTAFGAYLSLAFLSFRPVTFAIVLLGACAWLLLRDRRRDDALAAPHTPPLNRPLNRRDRGVWLIVPLTALITNLHLCAVVVPVWVAALFLGALWERREVKRYAALLVATALACLATPMLAGAVRTAWHYQAQDVMVAGGVISEMQPFWRGGAGSITAVVLAAFAMCLFSNPRPLRIGERVWLLASGLMMLRLGRFAPMFAFIAAPALAATLPILRDRALAGTGVIAVTAVILALGVTRIALDFPTSPTPMDQWINRHGTDGRTFPAGASAFVDRQVKPRSGRLITEFTTGGYVGWRLGDRYQVLLDGRTQLYTPAFWQATYLGTRAEAAKVLRDAAADAAVLPAGTSRFRAPLQELGWRPVYRDDFGEVLLPPPQ